MMYEKLMNQTLKKMWTGKNFNECFNTATFLLETKVSVAVVKQSGES